MAQHTDAKVRPISLRPVVFAWENLGPSHADRLSAVAASGRRTVALQFSSRSKTYAWEGTATDGFEQITVGDAMRPGAMALAAGLVRQALRIPRADVFLCHYELPSVLLAALALRLCGRRVFTMMDSKFDDRPRTLGWELIKALFLRPYCGALTASVRSRDYLRFLGVPGARIELGYDTLSVDRIAALAGAPPAPAGRSFAERGFVIVARHVEKKNIAMALHAFADWRARAIRPRDLHLCGTGPLEPALRSLAATLGIADAVRFHGFVQTDAVARILAESLCLLLPSVEEQYGLVVIEAQALGVPVLVSRNAGACDTLLVDGINGFVVDPAVQAPLAAQMLLLSEDESRWRRMASAAHAGRYRGDVRHFVAAVDRLVGTQPAARRAGSPGIRRV